MVNHWWSWEQRTNGSIRLQWRILFGGLHACVIFRSLRRFQFLPLVPPEGEAYWLVHELDSSYSLSLMLNIDVVQIFIWFWHCDYRLDASWCLCSWLSNFIPDWEFEWSSESPNRRNYRTNVTIQWFMSYQRHQKRYLDCRYENFLIHHHLQKLCQLQEETVTWLISFFRFTAFALPSLWPQYLWW